MCFGALTSRETRDLRPTPLPLTGEGKFGEGFRMAEVETANLEEGTKAFGLQASGAKRGGFGPELAIMWLNDVQKTYCADCAEAVNSRRSRVGTIFIFILT